MYDLLLKQYRSALGEKDKNQAMDDILNLNKHDLLRFVENAIRSIPGEQELMQLLAALRTRYNKHLPLMP